LALKAHMKHVVVVIAVVVIKVASSFGYGGLFLLVGNFCWWNIVSRLQLSPGSPKPNGSLPDELLEPET
jgi:hypothetical protein